MGMVWTHSLSLVIRSWLIHVWLMSRGGASEIFWKPATPSNMLVNEAVIVWYNHCLDSGDIVPGGKLKQMKWF